MSLIRWQPFRSMAHREPFGEIDTLRKEMDNLFAQFLSGIPNRTNGLTHIPSAEMDETDTEIHLKLEVPGMSADDLDIRVTEDTVSITGERQSESKSEDGDRVRSEFHYGKFERVVPLPSSIEREKVVAEYKDGILRLNLPKSEEHQEKSIKVNIG